MITIQFFNNITTLPSFSKQYPPMGQIHHRRRYLTQARSQGGGGRGGRTTPPQLPIPKILFHPLAILFHPLAILFHLSAILFHPLAILFHPSAILFHPLAILFHPSAILFHPLAILFHPWNMWMTSHGQCPRGGACECPRVGAFFKLMTSRGQCPRGGGGAPGVPPIQVQTPPPTWLAGYGPVTHRPMGQIQVDPPMGLTHRPMGQIDRWRVT